MQGNIARWLKKEGDKISPGEVLCEVETVYYSYTFLQLEVENSFLLHFYYRIVELYFLILLLHI